MKALTQEQLIHVSGGDSWAGTPEGRASVPMPEAPLGVVAGFGFGGIAIKLLVEIAAWVLD